MRTAAGPLVDEERHVICQAIFKDIEGEEWKRLYHKNVELHKAVNPKKPSTSKKTRGWDD